LVDGKKIIVTESIMRRDLQLEDAEGIDCLPTATIFEQLTLIGTMESAIICLAKNLKFNFSKYTFESMVKNLENMSGKFLMYPRFVQVFLEKQLEGMSNHKRIYVTPSHTKKIFRNMRRVGKGFSGRETPLFSTMMVQNQAKIGEGSAIPTDPHHTPTIIQPSTSQPQKKQKPRKPKRKDTEVPQPSGPTDNVADEAGYEEMDDSLERAATTATSLDAEQDRGSGPRCQEIIGDIIAQTGFKNVSKTSNGSLLAGVNTPRSDEDSLKLKELMELCTNLQNRVIDLEKTKTIESSEDEGLCEEDASKQGRIDDIDANEDIYLVNVHRDEDMFGVNYLEGDEVVVESEVAVKSASIILVSAATTTTVITDDEITLAKALAKLKSAKLPTTTTAIKVTAASTRPKAKGLIIHEEGQATTPTVSSQQPSQVKVQDKGKGI
ncbi:hypothetical protein Tco_0881542, partial [Tanacetum coccineum]